MLSMIINWFRRNETERDLVAREAREAREARWERRDIGKARIQAQRDIARRYEARKRAGN